jgi:hypothetical protein
MISTHRNISVCFSTEKLVTPEEEVNRRIYYYEGSKNILVVFDGDSYDVLNIFCRYKSIYSLFIYLKLRTYY